MKKFLSIFILVFVLILGLNSAVYAKNNIRFIYIHGTNDNNYKKKIEFTNDVKNLHKQLVVEFNNSELAKKYLMEDGKYTISETPIVFYWGAESKADLNLLADWLDITKFFSPKLAQTLRTMIAHSFHDAIWIQKYNNMKPVLNKLHKITSQVDENGDKYILLGHSAGTFITYEYFLYKLPFIDTQDFLSRQKLSQDKMKQIQKIGYRNTCVDAMIDTGFVVYKRDNTFYIPQDNLIQKYKQISQAEKTSCLSVDNAAGMINFGSPISLFYSGFGDNSDIKDTALITSIFNNNIFYLNLNFAEDPLGFPIISEADYSDVLAYIDEQKLTKNISDKKTNTDIKYGFMYDKSDIRSNKSALNAHIYYWRMCKFFAKSVVKAYEEGLTNFVINPNI